MKKILILGATGMLGHKLALKLSKNFRFLRQFAKQNQTFFIRNCNDNIHIIEGVDAFHFDDIEHVIRKYKPDYVLNCIGIVKQLAAANDPIISITINSLLPHRLEKIGSECGFKLIHFSTDCVFSGKKGPYKETDPSDVNDLYGITKFLGEISGKNALTIRSSIIGREFVNPTGLLEWFLSQKGKTVKGFKKALYSGVTTNAMGDLIQFIIENHADLNGVYHVSSPEISKYDLLNIVNHVAKTNITIEPDDIFECDRRLNSNEFHNATNWTSPSWERMIKTMFEEDKDYYITTS